MKIYGFTLLTRQSDGGLNLITRHPDSSETWLWGVSVSKSPVYRRWWMISRDTARRGQWHDYYRLPFGKAVIISRQDYHRKPS